MSDKVANVPRETRDTNKMTMKQLNLKNEGNVCKSNNSGLINL